MYDAAFGWAPSWVQAEEKQGSKEQRNIWTHSWMTHVGQSKPKTKYFEAIKTSLSSLFSDAWIETRGVDF